MSEITKKFATLVLGKNPDWLHPGEWRARLCAAFIGTVFAVIAGTWLTA